MTVVINELEMDQAAAAEPATGAAPAAGGGESGRSTSPEALRSSWVELALRAARLTAD